MEASAAEVVVTGLFGAVIGSFLNVVVHRLPAGESLVSPGSRCPACRTPLKPYDNVPVVSWLVLRGRCRNCGAPISPRYPLVELATALVFAAVVAARGFDDDLVLELPFVACLIALAGDRPRPPACCRTRSSTRWRSTGVIATLLVDRGDLAENLIAGRGRVPVPAAGRARLPARHGDGRREARRRDGPLPGRCRSIPALLAAFLTGQRSSGSSIIAREGAAGAQEGRPVRRVPGDRRHRRSARGARADRLLRDDISSTSR